MALALADPNPYRMIDITQQDLWEDQNTCFVKQRIEYSKIRSSWSTINGPEKKIPESGFNAPTSWIVDIKYVGIVTKKFPAYL